jgi:hypothetical protein
VSSGTVIFIFGMKNGKQKDPLAVALGRKRWAGKSKKERLAHVKKMNTARLTKMEDAKNG